MSNGVARKYDVYAVGTALIDYQYALSETQSRQFSLEHGGTIINAEQEQELLQQLSKIDPVRVCGGSGANTLAVISQLGGKTFYSCKVAADEVGQLYQNNLHDAKIETDLQFDYKQATGKCFIIVLSDGERILHSFLGANCNLSPQDLRNDIIKNANYIFIEAFSSAVSASSKLTAETAIKIAKQCDTKVALTLSTCRPSFISRHDFVKTAGTGVDLLFCNEFEANFFCGTEQLNIAKEKLKAIAKQFVITLGKEGALLFDGNQFIKVPAYSSNAIDTTGAGDIFAGAFLFAITHGASFLQAGNLASFAAAKSVTRVGARLSTSIINEIKKEHMRAYSA
ncbi:hypothetical protein AYO45_00910 [Gammaproteobacteria bacterium SCGC AG-212-F23]|nr:hypothetical protein AYO45_00910 [Gammaproteobacteria bacterium SCGC AG-212-F23]